LWGFLTFFPMMARPQGPPARDYLNVPIYQVRCFGDFIGTNGETAATSDVPLPNNVSITRNGYFSLLWSFPLGTKYGGIALSQGYANVNIKTPLGNLRTSDSPTRASPSMRTFSARLHSVSKSIPKRSHKRTSIDLNPLLQRMKNG
jgi:hypothetical protein